MSLIDDLAIEQSVTRVTASSLYRRCISSKTTDGMEYVAEFDDASTAAVCHTIIYPDGTRESWTL